MIFAVLRAVDERAHDIGGQKVGSELDAVKARLNRRGQHAHGKRLGQARHAFQQHVPVGEQPDQQPVNQLFLTDNHATDLGAKRLNPCRGCLDLLIQSCVHWGGS